MRPNRRRLLLTATATGLVAAARAHGQGGSQASPSPPASLRDEIWYDATRQRDIPVRIRWPAQHTPVPNDGRPVVLFSHGLGGTIAGGERWGEAWCAAGMVVLHLRNHARFSHGITTWWHRSAPTGGGRICPMMRRQWLGSPHRRDWRPGIDGSDD